MSVEFVPADVVDATAGRVGEAQQRASELCGPPGVEPGSEYWQQLFETNAAEVLSVLPNVHLADGFVVRYGFFGQHGNDIRVRPFVARVTTDVEPIRGLIEWHPAPDSLDLFGRYGPTQDVDLLYRHFSFSESALGFFEYWLAMQELWASTRWAHSHVVASAQRFSQLTNGDGWEILHSVERFEPAVAIEGASARLAVLVQCPLNRFEINLHQIDIGSDKALRYAEPIRVAAGPRGYIS